jgi:hypothetical protein
MNEVQDKEWQKLLEDFSKRVDQSIKKLEERDIDRIPGAKQALIQRLTAMRDYFPRNNGELLINSINDKIQTAFFPKTQDIALAFNQILKSRTHEQDFIINELINGFIASRSRAMAQNIQGTVLDRLVEAFSKGPDFQIVDHQFYAMFSDPNKARKYVKESLQNLVDLFGLEAKELIVEKDKRRSERKVYTFYTFPEKILDILKDDYILIDEELDEKRVSEKFDKTIFISIFLANLSVNRSDLKKIGGTYTVNGICAIFALILLLSLMPKLEVDETHPILREPSYNPDRMSVIPKSWMMKEVLLDLLEPLISIVSYRLGGGEWLKSIETSEVKQKIHQQIRFLIKDVNKWILGELCRVEVPIFVEIGAIFAEVFVGPSTEE